MQMKRIESKLLGESYVELTHDSGLKILVMEKPDYTGAFAMFGANYGSVDTCFRLQGAKEYTKVPEGIAHYLEHKLFESEELDAFERFAKTGASANAFTSFDRTCYLFQCSDHFEENLEILLDFVKSPYFTAQTVQKEQGIIGQEIRMYQDAPDWQVLFNLLRALYHNNPVRIDIAGTIESIAQITAELLYDCYNTFYNHSNMVLAVAGGVTAEQVLRVADKVLKKEAPVQFEQIIPEEPKEVKQKLIEETLSVDLPKFALGFKQTHSTPVRTAKEGVITDIALDIIAGKVSPLYHELLSKGLINTSFSSEYFTGRGFAVPMFTGESTDAFAVKEAILAKIRTLKEHGITDEDFDISRKRLYGQELRAFNDVDDLANDLVDCYFKNETLFDRIECYRTLTKADVEAAIRTGFDEENCSLSVIR